jgi:ABC-type Zn uptake system ZnuABC Zn-binding protein ZnuA
MRAAVCIFDKGLAPILAGLVLLASSALSAAEPGRISVAVTVDDVEAIAKVVGGDQVDTFTLFKGCILRKDLTVEKAVQERLLKADAVVWTGFFNESAAIHDSVKLLDQRVESPPLWIDVSRSVKRINVPTSSCFGYVEVSFMHGDPFFWLNPQNGAIIARNLAEGFAELRPEKKSYFLANAEAFGKAMEKDIARWRVELAPLKGLRIFSAQCGWQNFAQIGGPSFASCKSTPGQLPSPETLVDHVKRLKVQLIIVDPNTPPEYGRAFREGTGAKVIEVPSSVENLAGPNRSYSALFDRLIEVLQSVSKEQAVMDR